MTVMVPALITHALAQLLMSLLLMLFYDNPLLFFVMGGMIGIMVKFWDEQLRKVVTRFLDAPVCNIATGETLFKALANTLETRHIATLEQSYWLCL